MKQTGLTKHQAVCDDKAASQERTLKLALWRREKDIEKLRTLLFETEAALFKAEQQLKQKAKTLNQQATEINVTPAMLLGVKQSIKADVKKQIVYPVRTGKVMSSFPNISIEILKVLFKTDDSKIKNSFYFELTEDNCESILDVEPEYFDKGLRYGSVLSPVFPIEFRWSAKSKVFKASCHYRMKK